MACRDLSRAALAEMKWLAKALLPSTLVGRGGLHSLQAARRSDDRRGD
jgi:hypothetical protein